MHYSTLKLTLIRSFSIIFILLFSHCKIEQQNFKPHFYTDEATILSKIENISNAQNVEIIGQEINSGKRKIRVIAINVEIDDVQLTKSNTSMIENTGKSIAQYLKTQINEPLTNLGVNIIFYKPNSKEPVGSYAVPFDE